MSTSATPSLMRLVRENSNASNVRNEVVVACRRYPVP